MYINNCVEGKISECLFDTAHKTPNEQEVETLKLQLFTHNSFFTGEIQEDARECLILLIEILDKGFGLCPTNDNINSKVFVFWTPIFIRFRKIYYMSHMYNEIPNFWNH